MTEHADLLITGGMIVDGTGSPGRSGTLAVTDGRLRILGSGDAPPATGGQTIDATGKVVAPGFIDLHSHGALVILDEPRHEPKVRQGVTTEVVGVDGNGFAPFLRREDLEAFVHLDAGLDGRPDIGYDWGSVASYLDRYDGTVSINIATLIGNTPLRVAALGWDDVPADDRALDRMRGLIAEGMAEGAFGVSSGLDYPPGGYATTDELVALDRGGRTARRLLPHPRPLPARRPLSRPHPRGDRDRPAGRCARPHHPLLPSTDPPRWS